MVVVPAGHLTIRLPPGREPFTKECEKQLPVTIAKHLGSGALPRQCGEFRAAASPDTCRRRTDTAEGLNLRN
jgi:hypothetical protein